MQPFDPWVAQLNQNPKYDVKLDNTNT